jgi:hypothetical protein
VWLFAATFECLKHEGGIMHPGAPLRIRLTTLLASAGIIAACSTAPAGPTAAPTSQTGETTQGGVPKQPTTAAENFTYTGADRQQLLEEGARREGKVLWYTTQILNERAVPMANGFMR